MITDNYKHVFAQDMQRLALIHSNPRIMDILTRIGLSATSGLMNTEYALHHEVDRREAEELKKTLEYLRYTVQVMPSRLCYKLCISWEHPYE